MSIKISLFDCYHECVATSVTTYDVSLFPVEPTCSNDLLLHFPYDYDVNFDDITCHKAKGYSYGDGEVKIVNDPDRGQVAEFDGDARLEVCSVYHEPH